MALNTLSLPALSCTSAAPFASSSSSRYGKQPPILVSSSLRRNAALGRVICMAPEEEKLTRRNPLDFPIVSSHLASSSSFMCLIFFTNCIQA